MINQQILIYLYYGISSLLQSIAVILIAYIMMGWIVLGIQPKTNSTFMKIYMFLEERIEPIFTYCRQFLPPIMGLDFSPFLVFLAIEGIQYLLGLLFRILLSI